MDTDQRRAMLMEILRDSGAPGAAVALLVDGDAVFQAGIGSGDLDDARLLDVDAQFYIYSITKVLLATATLQLVEQGRLALDECVGTYLPTLRIPAPVSVRQVLNHTAGLPDYGGMREYKLALQTDPTRPWTAKEFLDHTLPRGLCFEPGHGWAYSNIGYLIIRLLLEHIEQASLREVLRARLFAPLGFRRTFVAETLTDTEALTPGYSTFLTSGAIRENIAPRYHPGWVSHGVVISTAAEVALLIEALFTGRLLGSTLLTEMLEPVLVRQEHRLFRQPAYGLGVMLDPASPHGLVVGHGGGGPGYSTGAIHVPDINGHRVTSIALVNSDRGDLGLPMAFALAETAI